MRLVALKLAEYASLFALLMLAGFALMKVTDPFEMLFCTGGMVMCAYVWTESILRFRK